jgi:hypothetical protein
VMDSTCHSRDSWPSVLFRPWEFEPNHSKTTTTTTNRASNGEILERDDWRDDSCSHHFSTAMKEWLGYFIKANLFFKRSNE